MRGAIKVRHSTHHLLSRKTLPALLQVFLRDHLLLVRRCPWLRMTMFACVSIGTINLIIALAAAKSLEIHITSFVLCLQ